MATLNIGDYNMLDLKNYSNEELQELRYSIDKELFNRNGDTSFSEYKVGEVYCQSRGVNNHTFFYIIKKNNIDTVHVDCIYVCNDYVDYSGEIEYSYKELRDKKLTKVDVSENELIEWHDELTEKMRVITLNVEKERKNLVNLYLEKIIKV